MIGEAFWLSIIIPALTFCAGSTSPASDWKRMRRSGSVRPFPMPAG